MKQVAFNNTYKGSNQAVQDNRLSYASVSGLSCVIGICFMSGISYIPLQWYRHENAIDAVFVSLLIAATVILMFGLRRLQHYMLTKGFDFYSFVMSTQEPQMAKIEHDNLCNAVINFKRMTICGLLYGLVIGSTPFVLNIWDDDKILKISLSVFMFTVNFATGIAFYGLIMFFYYSFIMGKKVKINLWHLENPSTEFLLGASRRISLLISIYICLCLSSILFSLIPVESLVIVYSCFSVILILFSLALPSFPIAQKLKEAKTQSLKQLDNHIESAFSSVCSTQHSEKNVALDSLVSLLQLREKIENVHAWPIKVKTVSTVLSVIVFSFIPVFLQFFLNRFFS